MKSENVNGFTLLEMMVVLAIVGLLSLGGGSSWQRWRQRQQLNDTAQQIQRLLQRVRSDANWHNATHVLWLKPGKRWCLGAGPALCRRPTRHTLPAPHAGISVRALTADLGFYGRHNAARPGRIVIASDAGERRVIVSSRGRVRICLQSEEDCR
ncbi:GspH/FimT family pseudopilin [Erwinia sp. Eh17-17]|uniref:GspH/FimT family pseudopilin n=1 Tax=Erwinia sp. Eh17-17 TaxID=3080330 RepID=UPI003209386F